ncbi:MAG: hypothetical protein H8E79_09215 [Desulfobulbaceae bacterium]|uniref:Cytoplasmic protein n=1 Tax=Candidatus Desulfatifera sulfidica TaxID=2841691 RepID=A0A8J6N9K4_9BACT|nr:hypothetical protein [Candidatus Desulfatifera sulfidica]
MDFDPHQICFGLNQETDRRSFAWFLRLAGQQEFAELLSSRLNSDEIEALTNTLTGLFKEHLSEDEYHTHFLREETPHHHHPEEIP